MKKKNFFILICFAVLITSILSPIASNEFVRTGMVHDTVIHIAHVIQAKAALDEGQFPVKTAPLMYSHFGYPVFQFYNSFLYTIMGAIYKFVTPGNPYVALKLWLWCCLLLGTVFIYKLIFWFVESEVIAFLSAVVYVMSPYLLINIFERGAIPETIAQGIIPVVLYSSLKLFFLQKFNLKYCVISAIAWAALAGTHLLTFLYFSLFFALFLIILTVINRMSLKHIIYVGLPYAYSLLLSSFFMIPILLFEKLTNVHNAVGMGGFEFETLFPILLSIIPTSPMPLPGNGRIAPGMKLYMGLGLPTLLAIGSMIYILFVERPHLKSEMKKLIVALLSVFTLAFFAVWTPINFWSYLPKLLQSAQFPWRLLTQTMWSGALLFAFAMLLLFGKKLNIKHGAVGLVLICVSLSPWITSQEVGSVHISEILKKPDFGYARDAYLVRPDAVQLVNSATLDIDKGQQKCAMHGKKSVCNIEIFTEEKTTVKLPFLYYPKMIHMEINGQRASYFPTLASGYVLGAVTLPKGSYKIEYYFQGLPFATWISAGAWLLILGYLILHIFRMGYLKFFKGIS